MGATPGSERQAHAPGDPAQPRASLDVPPHAQSALEQLYVARRSARHFKMDVWQFAVELPELLRVGLTKTDCRALVRAGVLSHAREISLLGAAERAFQEFPSLRLPRRTCFVLTDEGAALVRQLGWTSKPAPESPAAESAASPQWDRPRHTLTLGGALVKQFRLPAPNQEAILDAFQEEGWPSCVDDPLAPKAGQDPKRRLHDTIVSLNRNQKRARIRFFGDGTGQGVCWEPVQRD